MKLDMLNGEDQELWGGQKGKHGAASQGKSEIPWQRRWREAKPKAASVLAAFWFQILPPFLKSLAKIDSNIFCLQFNSILFPFTSPDACFSFSPTVERGSGYCRWKEPLRANKHEDFETHQASRHRPPPPAGSEGWGTALNLRKGRREWEWPLFCCAGEDSSVNKQNQWCDFLHHLKPPLKVWTRQCFLFGESWSLSGFCFLWQISHGLLLFGAFVISNFWEWQMSAPLARNNFLKSVCTHRLTQTELKPTGGKYKIMLEATRKQGFHCPPCTVGVGQARVPSHPYFLYFHSTYPSLQFWKVQRLVD